MPASTDWVDDWRCRSCGAAWSSRAARDTCEAIDADDDRDTRRA